MLLLLLRLLLDLVASSETASWHMRQSAVVDTASCHGYRQLSWILPAVVGPFVLVYYYHRFVRLLPQHRC